MRLGQFTLVIAAAVVGTAGAATALCAQGGFEGVVTFRTNNDEGKPGIVEQTTKGHKMKMSSTGEESGRQGAMIYDGDAGTMTMLDASQHKAVVFTKEDMERTAAMMKGMPAHMSKSASSDDDKLNFAPTGRTETVAGVRCQVWHGYTEHEGTRKEGDACIADGVGLAVFDMMANNPMMRGRSSTSMYAKYKALVGEGKGILKVVSYKDGKPVTELEATKIERRPVSDAEFKAPAGYQVVTMGGLMDQMRDMQKSQSAKPKITPPR